MDNQHRKITGYRELTQQDIDMMNEVKEIGKVVGDLVAKLRENEHLDQRLVSIGATQLQQGGMMLTRSIAQPDFFF